MSAMTPNAQGLAAPVQGDAVLIIDHEHQANLVTTDKESSH
jgi:hypothetical protein